MQALHTNIAYVLSGAGSCMTVNDGALGGDEISGNLMLNCNRETSDTGELASHLES